MILPFPNRRKEQWWMTLDDFEIHVAAKDAELAQGRLHMLQLQQFLKQLGEARP
jgi:hypothetical protein